MKRLTILLVSLALAAGMHAQGDAIDAILQQIEANNKQLRANAGLVSAQKLENKAENNLPNPSLSYSHLWDSDDKNVTVGELVISQGFDFPTLYATRGKLARMRNQALDAQAAALRQDILCSTSSNSSSSSVSATPKTWPSSTPNVSAQATPTPWRPTKSTWSC